MKFKKVAALFCAAVMACGMLAGCGSKTPEASKAPTTDGYDKTALENAGEITITWMSSGVETENDFETQVLPGLVKAKWPNVTLEVTKLPDDQYYTALNTRLNSGECPDLILVQPMWAGANACYDLANAGHLAPLNDLEYTKLAKDLKAMTVDGNIYSTANGVSMLGVFYNKDMFAEVGIDGVPATWDEFLSACEKLKAAGIQPITMGDKDQYVLQFGLYQLAANMIYPKNADYDNQLRTGETKFTDEGTWDVVLGMYKELYDKGYIDASQSLGMGATQAQQTFIDGQAAMIFDGNFNTNAVLAIGAGGEFERGYFPMPGAQNDGNVYTATCLSSGMAIYSGSDYIDECKQLLDWIYDGESEAWDAMIGSGRYIFTYGEGADSAPNYDLFKPFIDLMNDGKAYHWCNQAWPSGTEVEMEALFSACVGGQGTTVEDITAGMQAKFEDLLAD